MISLVYFDITCAAIRPPRPARRRVDLRRLEPVIDNDDTQPIRVDALVDALAHTPAREDT